MHKGYAPVIVPALGRDGDDRFNFFYEAELNALNFWLFLLYQDQKVIRIAFLNPIERQFFEVWKRKTPSAPSTGSKSFTVATV
jgi:hypothetical protein